MIKLFLNNKRIEKILSILPYFNLIYFLEIIYIMVFIYFIYGEIIAVLLGIALFSLLTFIIYSIYFRMERGRKLQILWFDIHIAATIPFILFKFLGNYEYSFISILFIVLRFLMSGMEILYLLLLTDVNVKSSKYQ